jgi:hypothetical protein
MHQQNISITALGGGGMAFGYAADGQGVYVPKGVASAAKVEAFGVYSATLIPNRYRPDKTELMAVRVEPFRIDLASINGGVSDFPAVDIAQAFRELTPGQITIEALDIVKAGGVWTASALIEEICGSGWRERYPNILAHVSVYLRKAFLADELSRCEVYQRPGQSNPSAVLYAVDWKDLL